MPGLLSYEERRQEIKALLSAYKMAHTTPSLEAIVGGFFKNAPGSDTKLMQRLKVLFARNQHAKLNYELYVVDKRHIETYSLKGNAIVLGLNHGDPCYVVENGVTNPQPITLHESCYAFLEKLKANIQFDETGKYIYSNTHDNQINIDTIKSINSLKEKIIYQSQPAHILMPNLLIEYCEQIEKKETLTSDERLFLGIHYLCRGDKEKAEEHIDMMFVQDYDPRADLYKAMLYEPKKSDPIPRTDYDEGPEWNSFIIKACNKGVPRAIALFFKHVTPNNLSNLYANNQYAALLKDVEHKEAPQLVVFK